MQKNKALGIILIAILACSTGILIECLPPASATVSWLDGYDYRKTQTIIGSTGAGYNYQLYYKVYRTAGVDDGYSVYLDGKCKSDFGDIRFADTQNPPTVFDYWIAKKTTDYAEFWVNASTLDLDNNATIAIYYGNENATDESNFEATFVFGELWDNATFNTAKWNSSGTSPGISIDTVQHQATITSSSTGYYYALINLPDNYIIEDAYNYQGAIYLYNRFGSSSVHASFVVGTHHDIPSVSDYLALGLRFYKYTTQQPYSYYLGYHLSGIIPYDKVTGYSYSSSSQTVGFKLWNMDNNNYIDINGVNKTATSSESPNMFVFGSYIISSSSTDVLGAFKVRKYVDIEPIQSTWNSEETPSTGSSNNNVQIFWSTGGSGVSINGQTVTQNGSWVSCEGNITIGAMTKNQAYLFRNITISNITSTLLTTENNPVNFNLPSENVTIWCNFAAAGSIQPYTYARFTFTPSNPMAGNTTVTLNGTLSVSNEPIYAYLWDFGDNSTSTETYTNHMYTNPGIYAVSLTVTSDAGKDTITQQINVD